MSERDLCDRFLGGLRKPLLTRAEMLNAYLADQVAHRRPQIEQALEDRCDAEVARLKEEKQPDRARIAAVIDEKYASLARIDQEASVFSLYNADIQIRRILNLKFHLIDIYIF